MHKDFDTVFLGNDTKATIASAAGIRVVDGGPSTRIPSTSSGQTGA